ncbi:hypothetical protein DRF59_18030 [Chryseobacterium flavum]|uniref:Uncharacterized protein n=1 Tax=Chryseobacterium flavum TaxID=415851 RepID=A0A3D9CGW0_9FLAO|nr:hypothetical protein DRF59_18030 [Chryseobacterium flavum]
MPENCVLADVDGTKRGLEVNVNHNRANAGETAGLYNRHRIKKRPELKYWMQGFLYPETREIMTLTTKKYR